MSAAPQRRRLPLLTLAAAFVFFSPAQARELVLLDELPPQVGMHEIAPALTDILARQRWRILPGNARTVNAQHHDKRTICRATMTQRGQVLLLNDDCRKAAANGRWIADAERRAIPEAWLQPVRRELRARFPRPTPLPAPATASPSY